jgi:hypothetical protein
MAQEKEYPCCCVNERVIYICSYRCPLIEAYNLDMRCFNILSYNVPMNVRAIFFYKDEMFILFDGSGPYNSHAQTFMLETIDPDYKNLTFEWGAVWSNCTPIVSLNEVFLISAGRLHCYDIKS